jgi:hypothetical protein
VSDERPILIEADGHVLSVSSVMYADGTIGVTFRVPVPVPLFERHHPVHIVVTDLREDDDE